MPSTIWQQLEGALIALYKFLTHPDLGNIASIAGAVISFYVLRSVRDLRKRVLFKVRAPDAISDISDRASKISELMHDLESAMPRIDEHIFVAQETLKNIREKITGQPNATIDETIGIIDQYRKLPREQKTRDVIDKVYLGLLVSTAALKHLVADFRQEP